MPVLLIKYVDSFAIFHPSQDLHTVERRAGWSPPGQRLSDSDVRALMGQSSSTGRGTNAAGRRPTAPANGSAAAQQQQQQQRRVAAGGGYPGASTVAQFDVNSGNSQAIPNIGQMQNIFLEGTRPDLARLNNPQRQAAPQAQLQRTFTIRNDVNLKKNSLRLVADEEHSERYHLEFVFDAAAECGITVHYAATEISGEPRPRFVPLKEGGLGSGSALGLGLGSALGLGSGSGSGSG